MKEKKIKYSLTAKQRKEQRAKAAEKNAEKKEPVAPVAESEISEQPDGAIAEKKLILGLDVKRFVLLAACILIAVALIVVAVLLPTVIIPRVTYGKVNNPVAVIYLSNNETLEFEVYENEVPIAATNFLYLAKNGYFDGSIIFDRQNGFMRFGGFYDTEYNHRESDEKFSARFTDIVSPSDKRKFEYRLSTDNTQLSKFGTTEGYLSFMQNSSSTEFQICTETGSQLTASNGDNSPRTLNAVSFARYLNGDVLSKIKTMYANMENTVAYGRYWRYPVPVITIKKIKLYNMDRSKWKNFNFDEFFKNKISGWYGGSISE